MLPTPEIPVTPEEEEAMSELENKPAQSSGQAAPSDDAIISLAYDCNAMPEAMTDAGLKRFARALLSRYGQAPAASAAPAELTRLRQALVYVAHSLHDTRQYMLADGITLMDAEGVRVKIHDWTVEAFDYSRDENPRRRALGVYGGTTLAAPVAAQAPAAAGDARDTARMNWLVPNLHPANFGLDYDRDRWENGEYLAVWREAIDGAMQSTTEQAGSPQEMKVDPLVQDMAMLIKRMARRIRTDALRYYDNTRSGAVADEAMTFLRQHGLEGSPLREGGDHE